MATTPAVIKIDVKSAVEAMKVALEPVLERIELNALASEAVAEVYRARAKHGKQGGLPDGTGSDQMKQMADWARANTDRACDLGEMTRLDILLEEVYEAAAEDDLEALDAELNQVGGVILAWRLAIAERRRVQA
jgi:hypothetical protein